MQRDSQFLVGGEQFRVNLIQALRRIRRRPRRGIIRDVLVVDGLVAHMSPGGLLHRLPVPKCFQPPIQQKFRFVFLFRDCGDHVLIESGRQAVGLDVGDKAVAIFLADQGFDFLRFARHGIPGA